MRLPLWGCKSFQKPLLLLALRTRPPHSSSNLYWSRMRWRASTVLSVRYLKQLFTLGYCKEKHWTNSTKMIRFLVFALWFLISSLKTMWFCELKSQDVFYVSSWKAAVPACTQSEKMALTVQATSHSPWHVKHPQLTLWWDAADVWLSSVVSTKTVYLFNCIACKSCNLSHIQSLTPGCSDILLDSRHFIKWKGVGVKIFFCICFLS